MDSDMIRELAPFGVGILLSPALMILFRPQWSTMLRFTLTALCALVIGAFTSWLAGELIAGLLDPDSLIAIVIDTSLVMTGSQLAYRFVWKPLLGARFQRAVAPAGQSRM